MSFHRTSLYGPQGHAFVCETAEQHAELLARGWQDTAPAAPQWVARFDECPGAEAPPDAPPEPKKPGRKPKA